MARDLSGLKRLSQCPFRAFYHRTFSKKKRVERRNSLWGSGFGHFGSGHWSFFFGGTIGETNAERARSQTYVRSGLAWSETGAGVERVPDRTGSAVDGVRPGDDTGPPDRVHLCGRRLGPTSPSQGGPSPRNQRFPGRISPSRRPLNEPIHPESSASQAWASTAQGMSRSCFQRGVPARGLG